MSAELNKKSVQGYNKADNREVLCVCVCVHTLKTMQGVISYLGFLKQALSLVWDSQIWLGWLANELQGSASLCFPGAEVYRHVPLLSACYLSI